MAKNRKKIALVLGSGGFRGPAHIGVIKSFITHGIPIDYIVGSSIGSYVGAHYSLFQDVSRLEKEIFGGQKEKLNLLLDLTTKGGILSGKHLEKMIGRYLENKQFKDLNIPLKIVATDLVGGEQHIFQKGDLAQAVRASISIPLTFQPYPFKNKLLVDGGITNPVPDNVAKSMGADIVVSVNLYNKYSFAYQKPSAIKSVMRAAEIMLRKLAEANLKHTDVLIEPDTSGLYKIPRYKKYLDSKLAEHMIIAGEEATEAVIPKIKALLES